MSIVTPWIVGVFILMAFPLSTWLGFELTPSGLVACWGDSVVFSEAHVDY